MHADPEPHRSGSLKEKRAVEPAAMAAVALAFQVESSPLSSLYNMGMYSRSVLYDAHEVSLVSHCS